MTTCAAHQSPSFSVIVGFAQLLGSNVANTRSRHLGQFEVASHQDVGHFHDLDGCVDAIDISGRVSLSDTEALRLGNCLVHGGTSLHGFQDYSRRRVDNAAKSAQLN